MLYLDTSALLKLYVREAGSETVQRIIESQDEPLPVGELQEMELINALRLKVFWKELTPRQAERQVELFDQRRRAGLYYTPDLSRAELIAAFRRLAKKSASLGTRTLDVLHVAYALIIGADRFVSFDERQLRLAEAARMDVLRGS